MSAHIIRRDYPCSDRGLFHDWGATGCAHAVFVLRSTGYLSPEDLANILEDNIGYALPDELHAYLLRVLRGKAPKRRGPKPRKDDAFYAAYAGAIYTAALAAHSATPTGRRRKAKQGDEAAHRKAIDEVRQHVRRLRNMTPESIINFLSAYNALPHSTRRQT